ncbi:MAG: acyltransferase [Clostridia bacterium]|nr:acyltransferase [Clostridia bacterium]
MNTVSLAPAKKPQRLVYLDFLKIIAIFLVLFNHTATHGFMLFTVERDSALYPFYLFNAIFIKIAVPLFFMVSGALLLGKEESYKTLLRKRFFKFLLVLIVASAFSYLYQYLRYGSKPMSLGDYLTEMYSHQAITAYWYLYAYLAFILMLPLLRKLAQSMTDREYRWMFLVYGAVQCLSIFEYLVWKGEVSHNGNFSVFIMTSHVFFPLIGYYLDQKMSRSDFTGKRLLLLTAVSVLAIVLCCLMTHGRCTLTGNWNESDCQKYFNTLIFLPAITVFYAAKYLFLKHRPSERLQRLITAAGCTTFGIYLLEKICREETKPIYVFLKPYVSDLPACWLWILCACLLGGCVTYVLKMIPGIKNFI